MENAAANPFHHIFKWKAGNNKTALISEIWAESIFYAAETKQVGLNKSEDWWHHFSSSGPVMVSHVCHMLP
jgi:hypothetical protein